MDALATIGSVPSGWPPTGTIPSSMDSVGAVVAPGASGAAIASGCPATAHTRRCASALLKVLVASAAVWFAGMNMTGTDTLIRRPSASVTTALSLWSTPFTWIQST